MAKLHRGVVVINGTVDTTHHTLVITEKEDGETSDTVDGDEKATLLIPVDYIRSRDDVHGGGFAEHLVVSNVFVPKL